MKKKDTSLTKVIIKFFCYICQPNGNLPCRPIRESVSQQKRLKLRETCRTKNDSQTKLVNQKSLSIIESFVLLHFKVYVSSDDKL